MTTFWKLGVRTVFLAAMFAAVGGPVWALERPNILFLYTDDQSHRTVSCYEEADPYVRTPHIDALAASGIRFRYAYTGTWCMPSRATLLTGRLQHAIESMRMEGPYPGSEYDPVLSPFWPKIFRQEGYQTAQIGKWHTGTDTGFGRDWDYQVVWNRPRHTSNAGSYYKDQMIEKNGGEAELVMGYSTDNYTKWAIDYLRGEGRDADKPWYLWLCYGAVHGPFTPAERHREAYPGATVAVPEGIYPPRPGKPEYAQRLEAWFRGEDGKPHLRGSRRATGEMAPGRGIHGSDLDSWVRQYHQGVLALDEGVGQLMEVLKETGQYENTLVVFTSDQGFAWGQHGLRQKVAPYDGAIRCPMIIAMPSRLPQGVVREEPVGGADLVPTFFSLAGIELPWKMHGRDLWPILEGGPVGEAPPLLTVHTGSFYGSDTHPVPADRAVLEKTGGIPWYASLHDGRYKYIRTFVEGEMEELYDLAEDPEEMRNLALESGQAGRLAAMREATVAELRRTEAPFADALPAVRGVVAP